MMMVLFALCGVAQAGLDGLVGFVTIGNAGNAADGTTGYGAVGYTYQISKTEVTIAEFQLATGVGNNNENDWSGVGPNAPAVNVSLYEAKKYANYLTQNANGGSSAYNLYSADGTGAGSYTRADAISDGILVYALPTEDEWYKAAYYKPVNDGSYSLYANGTDTVPTHGTTAGWNYYNGGYVNGSPNYTWTAGYGGVEQNGTYDMMGNVWEWMEDSGGVLRGGSYGSDGGSDLRSSDRNASAGPAYEATDIGFRVVAIPEPASAMLVFFGAGIGLAVHRARRTAMRR
jgi:formylglycine-generating enzyme required for sulfatase activity